MAAATPPPPLVLDAAFIDIGGPAVGGGRCELIPAGAMSLNIVGAFASNTASCCVVGRTAVSSNAASDAAMSSAFFSCDGVLLCPPVATPERIPAPPRPAPPPGTVPPAMDVDPLYPPKMGGRGVAAVVAAAAETHPAPSSKSISGAPAVGAFRSFTPPGEKTTGQPKSSALAPPSSRAPRSRSFPPSDADAYSSSLGYASNGDTSLALAGGGVCDDGGPNELAIMLAIAALPSLLSKFGSDAGSSRNPNRSPPSPSPSHPGGSAGSPPSSTNASIIAGRARASTNVALSALCSISNRRASSLGSPPSPLPPGPAFFNPPAPYSASVAATYTAAP
eukprot:30612-Pelagococcus_subviridis.AAC.31